METTINKMIKILVELQKKGYGEYKVSSMSGSWCVDNISPNYAIDVKKKEIIFL